MDQMVYKTQKWLNQHYQGVSGYKELDLSDNGGIKGRTGWTTIYALTRALQIELGVPVPADNFGPTTEQYFKEQYPNGIFQQSDQDTTTNKIYGIIQGALWCKGYPVGSSTITTHFYEGTGTAIKMLKEDMGINSSSSTVTLNIMKALLSMDQFVPLEDYGGSLEISDIQKALNRNYENYIGIIPTDGIYGRSMNLALIKVLQSLEGYSVEEATGNFGEGTKKRIIILPDYQTPEAVKLFKYCLICNGYSVGTTSVWNDALVTQIKAFQTEYMLPQTGKGDLDTWMSLLLSKGNTDRSDLGCDCSTILDSTKATALYNSGYRYVGRYLTGTVGSGSTERPKNLTRIELEDIFNAGLRVFAIFQEGVPSLNRYTYTKGMKDGFKAVQAACNLGIPENEIIYFAIDYDIMDGQISSSVIPYFQGIRASTECFYFKYKIGIYGARNVCTRVCNLGLAVSSFVSDMSTGFSGNMGYRIPKNWAFDQFYEYMFYYSKGAFALDKDAVSGRYLGFDYIRPQNETMIPIPTEDDYIAAAKNILDIFELNRVIYNLQFNKEYSLQMGADKVTFEIGNNFSFEEDTNVNWSELTISGGVLPLETMELSTQLWNNLDATIKAEAGLEGTSLNFELAQTIQHGNIKSGVAVNALSQLELYYLIEQILWTNEDGTIKYSVFVSIKYTLDNKVSPGNGEPEKIYDYSPAPALSSEEVMCFVIVMVIVCAAVASGGTGAPAIASSLLLIGA